MKYLLIALGVLILAEPATAAPKWDLNGDGKMTRDEFAQMISSRTVELTDTNKDGRISLAEWTARPVAQKAKAAGRPEMRFDTLDSNKDGFVVAADFAGSLEKRFDRLDANKDGSLSKEERQAARKVTKAN
ncbi:MAG: acid-shock protein [Proteobacteria bacterium]|nr:acid-shock protein [Pseudomonadota bacterium]